MILTRKSLYSLTMTCLAVLSPSVSIGSVIYESAYLGATAIAAPSVLLGDERGYSIAPNMFLGVRFDLPAPVRLARVGGHLLGFGLGGVAEGERGTIFGAIVALTGSDDLPDSFDLSTPDVIASTLIDLPELSAEVFGDLRLTLDPGWYALVFGGGAFGADLELGIAVAIGNGAEIGEPEFIGNSLSDYQGGFEVRGPSTYGARFVIEGIQVPEPTSLALMVRVILCLAVVQLRRVLLPSP